MSLSDPIGDMIARVKMPRLDIIKKLSYLLQTLKAKLLIF